ncbi:MAG: S8 family serine peptidase [Bacteriovoracaceae bacterium]|jgi:hypothetical protein|nr:S8 family serine peptidase [Bacteriovoracaceae bacterium]
MIILLVVILSFSSFCADLVVEFKNKLSENDIAKLVSHKDIKSVELFSNYSSEYFDRLYSVAGSKQLKGILAKMDNVALVEENFDANFFEIKPNQKSEMATYDMLFPLQWGLFNQRQVLTRKSLSGLIVETSGKVSADIGWKGHIDSIEKKLKKTPVVAVVDMGIDLDHPELKDQIYKNEVECNENGKATGGTKEDKDNNKYPGDCHGWNFATTDNLYWQYPLDDKNHGTHIAGIIAAKKNNKFGVSGVSDKIKILPVRVTGTVDETSNRNKILMRAPSKRIANGILYSIRRGVDVINLSLGWPKTMDTKFMRQVIAEAVSKNIIVVAAAGNNNTNATIYPCAYYDVICVGATTIDGSMANFSNYGGQVDILAPGDQIVSTIPKNFIPLKLNIQGYEILSGTSQAAPFVSAAAALLKGANPQITHAALTGKLIHAADKNFDKKKSLHGQMHLGRSFDQVNEPVIKPIFKQFNEIVIDKKNSSFRFLLNLRNYGTEAQNIIVKLKSQDDVLVFAKPVNIIENMQDSKPVTIEVLGRVQDQLKDMKTTIVVEITVNDKTQIYKHELVLANNLFSYKSQNKKFFFKGKPLPIGMVKDGRIIDNLRTVSTNVYASGKSSYYLKFQDKDKVKVDYFQRRQNGYFQVANSFEVMNATKLISVTRGDYNLDGTDDLLIKTLIRKNGDGYILYSYRDLNLKPLVGKYSDIRYRPNVLLVNDKSLTLKATKVGEYTLATPVFIENGPLPIKDQVNDPWAPKDKSNAQRLYELHIVEKDDAIEYDLRSQTNKEFIISLKDKLRPFTHSTVAFDDTRISLLGFKNISKDQMSKGQITVYLSYGVGFYKKNFIVNFVDGTYNVKEINTFEKIEDADLINLISLDKAKVEINAFVSYISSKSFELTIDANETRSYIFNLDNEENFIQSFLALFSDAKKDYYFVESVDYIEFVGADKVSGNITRSKRNTTKFSFLPGFMMSEIFYPIVGKKDGINTPAIYVDGTRISGNHVYVNTIIEDKLVAPISSSIFIPRGCVTKNPIQNNDGSFDYVFLCNSKNGFYLKTVPVKFF